jgi:hypothetical protein
MTPHHIALVAVAAAAPTAQQNQDIGQTIREAVDQATREATQEAQQAAREAQQQARQEQQQAVRDAQQEVRDAQQQLRDAQQQLREATTPDQRGAANQAIMAAQGAIDAAQNELRRVQSQVGSNQGFPGITIQPPHYPQAPTIPAGAIDIAFGLFITCAVIVVGWPISRALGRRFEKRGTTPLLDASVADQLQRIEQAVEAVAIEVERVSESQRFLTRLQEKSPSTVE